ncbi:uncharacterized protein LOC114374490 isoform X2 [Glycine soja]|uniref:uncharacterized protein LOC114374490 isoform X2 n=1 Tax=Glycine soja TaxID=3848 RepID=UPI00103C4767|nr:uncharacterized protein LOC114374490 isoform X2 [Glycine soja]XP_028187943.1 uncharacterized protein LOC114374490 isoform X2 [Glycine soja]
MMNGNGTQTKYWGESSGSTSHSSQQDVEDDRMIALVLSEEYAKLDGAVGWRLTNLEPVPVLRRGSLCFEVSGKSSSEGWNSKFDYISMGNHGETQNTTQKDMSSIYQEQRLQPCQLSSSIHYGGQDIYSCPKSTQDSGYNSLLYKKDGVEDDLGSNLWQDHTCQRICSLS